ncbi:MAG: DUF4080 domain-containing protein [Ruminococcus sp.]|nr:DUF4080 domain-containing protein [Candidatus Copronaster equi]
MSCKKINLIAVNSQYVHSSLAVASLEKMYRKYTNQYNYAMPELSVTELSVNDSFDSLIYRIMDGSDIFAFSVYIWNINIVTELCRYIKSAYPESTIILGGPEVSFGGEYPCDYIISGEGERTFFALICELCEFEIPCEWNYSSNGNIRFSENISNLEEIDFPYNNENIEKYRNKIIYYESSRGCPFSCAYCLSSVCGKVRELSLNRVFSDLDFFISHNVAQVKFVDRTFNFNKKRSLEIWSYIIENAQNCDTNFHFEVGADLLSDEEMNLLSKAPVGKIQLEAGIQSTFVPALDECCRHTDNEKLFNNISQLISYGNINIHIDLIAGLPYESYEIFKQSFNEAYKLKAHQLQLGFLKLLHGAPLNRMIEKHSYVFQKRSPYEVIYNKYISSEEIRNLKKLEDVLERFYNSGRFSRTLEILERKFTSPFEMFEKIAEQFDKENLLFTPVSTKILFDFMSRFLKSKEENCDKILLLDFYSSEKSETVPSKLRYLVPHEKIKIKSEKQKGNKKAQIRMIENTAYVIDYSKRNKVNGNFEVIDNVSL